MNFINLRKTFTIFGSYAVFDEECISIIYKLFDKCNISINQEPNNANNKSGKVMIIKSMDMSIERRYEILLRPYRIDIVLLGSNNNQLKTAMELFKSLASVFDNPYGTRIAFVRSDFVYDDNSDLIKEFASFNDFLTSDKTVEYSLRTNTLDEVLGEEINKVLTINNGSVTQNNSVDKLKRSALLFEVDVNTIIANNDERFAFDNIEYLFKELCDKAKEMIDKISYSFR